MPPELLSAAALATLLLPGAASLALALLGLTGLRASEGVVGRLACGALWGALCASLVTGLGVALRTEPRHVVDLGPWFEVPGFALQLSLSIDPTAAVVSVAITAVCALVGQFSLSYLHQERRFLRFFALLLAFTAAMGVVVLAGNLLLLFCGWEVLGLAAALLIGFFDERAGPVRNALRSFVCYRVCDLGLLLAIGALLHQGRSLELPAGPAPVYVGAGVALGLVLGAAGKSALLPVSGWLPRAMEGPTPSSALCYGAVSVHAGAYLLLRCQPWLEASPAARWVLGAVALATAVWATLCARVQTDVKNGLAFACLTQVSVILLELALGLWTLALVHMLGHMGLRTLQLLRAPNALRDARLRAAVGGPASAGPPLLVRPLPGRVQEALWMLAVDRFHVDLLLERCVVRPTLGVARGLDRLEGAVGRVLDRRRVE